jgi:TPR repeat protein
MNSTCTLQHGVAVDFAKAIALFTRAAEAGDAVSQFCLGINYLHGMCGVARDVAKARGWLARAAAGGNAKAAEKLAALDAATPS